MRRSLLNSVRRYLSADLAIDLGTANTRLYSSTLGLIADQPSLIDPDESQSKTADALADHRNVQASPSRSPLAQGVIVDKRAAASLLAPLIKRGCRPGLLRPRILACAPTDTTEQERQLLTEVLRLAGASNVAIVPEPLAAAVGSGMAIGLRQVGMVMDIGAGITDIAVIQEGRVIQSAAVRIACNDMQRAIGNLAEKRYGVLPQQKEMERLTQILGVPIRPVSEETIPLTGCCRHDGRGMTINMTRQEVIEALEPIFSRILDTLETAWRNLSNKLACEIIESGIYLTGGGACIRNIDRAIALRTNLTVQSAADPIHAVIHGAVKMIDHIGRADHLWETITWPIPPSSSHSWG